MITIRKRLVFWLLKAYIKKWRKLILFSFVIGIAFFFLLRFWAGSVTKVPVNQKEVIGIAGDYTVETLPASILRKVSQGLTSIDKGGKPEPGLAVSWEIQDAGKTYLFHLKKGVYFTDGSLLKADEVNYHFSDVVVERPDQNTVVYRLKESYAPFLVKVSKPLFKGNVVGIGDYKLSQIKLNGDFVQSLTLTQVKNPAFTKTYRFYPTLQAVKLAYLMGEVTSVQNIPDTTYAQTSLSTFPNSKVEKKANTNKLVTLFYNTQDKVLSDKRLREALNYSLPDEFAQGKRAYVPFSSDSWVYDPTTIVFSQDLARAKELLDAATVASTSARLSLTISASSKYLQTAKDIATAWKKLGIDTKINEVNTLPTVFQIYLGDFNIPTDPDQYTLWHSSQDNNITRYDSQRIDKLLEDGRQILDFDERKKIYEDFQKYLLADAPASFLYYPYEYTVTRK